MNLKIFLLIISIVSLQIISAKENDNLLIPKNIIVISQSCDMGSVYVSVIDLDNNELVIINYDYTGKLKFVKKTGMIINIDKQNKISGKDAPFKSNN